MSHEPDDLTPELLDVAHALERHRPRMAGPELARVRSRIGSSRTSTAARGGRMRSRLAIVALLASGALLCTSGAAGGVSALSTTTSAGEAQYGTNGAVRSSADTLGGDSELRAKAAAGDGGSGVQDASSHDVTPIAQAQTARQLEAGGRDELPFTGYAAIPLLLIGILLLTAGLLIRRGTGRRTAGA